MKKAALQYTGTNYDRVKAFAGDHVLAPYICMGFSMLSLLTREGYVDVQEGDYIVREEDGSFTVSYEPPLET